MGCSSLKRRNDAVSPVLPPCGDVGGVVVADGDDDRGDLHSLASSLRTLTAFSVSRSEGYRNIRIGEDDDNLSLPSSVADMNDFTDINASAEGDPAGPPRPGDFTIGLNTFLVDSGPHPFGPGAVREVSISSRCGSVHSFDGSEEPILSEEGASVASATSRTMSPLSAYGPQQGRPSASKVRVASDYSSSALGSSSARSLTPNSEACRAHQRRPSGSKVRVPSDYDSPATACASASSLTPNSEVYGAQQRRPSGSKVRGASDYDSPDLGSASPSSFTSNAEALREARKRQRFERKSSRDSGGMRQIQTSQAMSSKSSLCFIAPGR